MNVNVYRTVTANFTWPKTSLLWRYVLIKAMPSRKLYNVRDDIIVRDRNRLFMLVFSSNPRHMSFKLHTLGFPVVPEEKHKKATFLLASPGVSFVSKDSVG